MHFRLLTDRRIFALLLGFVLLQSCTKDNSATEEAKAQTDLFKAYILQKQNFKITEFYAAEPIDYDLTDSDTTKHTNLNQYIRNYLLDDVYSFGADNKYDIAQNSVKIPGNTSNLIQGSYDIYAHKNDVLFRFADYDYSPFTYTLKEFNDSSFITVYVLRGVELYTKYEKTNP